MSITLDELIFDPANPDDGANVGATLRGADGTVIGNTGDALKVTGDFNITNAEVEISNDSGNPIPVSATDLDIRDLSFAQDSVDVSGSSNVGVTATNFDIRDLQFATDSVDVSGSSNVGVTATDLDIRDLTFAQDKVDASGSIVKDDAFESIKNSAQTINTTASQLAATPLADRTMLLIQNLGNKAIFVGQDNTVTNSNGIKIPSGGSAEFKWGATVTPFAITESGTADVRLMEQAY